MQKLPIGISEFSELREENCVYVDKTKYVYSLLKNTRRTFLSRPRRFGKSLLVSTLAAALQGKKELFEGLWIEKSDYAWKPQGVIRFDFSELSIESSEAFKRSLLVVMQRIANQYGITLSSDLSINSALGILIDSLCNEVSKKPFESVAILIDEYDHPILHTLHNPKLAIEIRDVMKSFSAVIKARAVVVKFVFVTGVSAFSKAGLSSGLNNLTNLTMRKKFFDICGYTDKEVDLYFKKHIKAWAEEEDIPYKTLREDLKSWYNGYCFEEKTATIYSPFSLTCALDAEKIQNFWFESATPQFLLDELSKAERQQECHYLNLEDLTGNMNLLQTFEIECIPLTALLFQMGYLTIKARDPITQFYQLKFPNEEVKTALHIHLCAALTKASLSFLNSILSKLFSALLEENMEELITCLTSVFSNIPYQLYEREKKPQEQERFYHAIVQALFVAAGIRSTAEYSTAQERADIIIALPKFFYIIEVKVNKSPEVGLAQIEEQKYYTHLLHFHKPIRAVGLSFHRKKADAEGKSSFSITYASKML